VKVLIIKPSSLGDIIHTLRVVQLLVRSCGGMEIHWVVKKGLEGILEASGIVDQIFLFERGGGFFKYYRLGQRLRAEKYDCVLDLQGLLRSAVLAKWANGKQTLGRADGREGATLFYQSVGEPDRQRELHAIERIIPFVEEFGVEHIDDRLSVDFQACDHANSLDVCNLPTNERHIVLFPESRRKEKVWPHFRQLTEKLVKAKLGSVLIAGNHPDDQFQDCIDLRGKVSLRALPVLVGKAALVVSNDSAPLHLASAVGCPLIGLFGPTEASRYGPYPQLEPNTTVLSSPTETMAGISVSKALQAADALLKNQC
jgi:lipopolysaccharide heptosyltransferase I